MNNEEIDYWLRYFSNHNHGFMSEDGKKITLFKVFQELKELQYLLKIKNDYINELQQENQKYKEVIDKLSSQIKLYGKYNGEKCTRGFSMMTADFNKLLDILKGGENE